jgi:hypothetical protein
VIKYTEIDDPKELARLNRILAKNLAARLEHRESREIGYPQGRFRADVRFESKQGRDVFWWSNHATEKKHIAHNFFGHGIPGSKEWLNIDVQFNLPVGRFDSRSGGAFLRHDPTGKFILAHRGIVTRGHGRIRKAILLGEMAPTVRAARTQGGERDFLLIGELDSPSLVSDISDFARELRRTVRAIKEKWEAGRTGGAREKATSTTKRVHSETEARLRGYFHEFTGQRSAGRTKLVVTDCYHGTVVRALRDKLGDSADVFKTREIDLVALTKKRVLLFEVKTSASTQSIYTAVGQLFVHTSAVERAVNGTPEKVLVLREQPADVLGRTIAEKLGISVLTFRRSREGHITINGLDRFKE